MLLYRFFSRFFLCVFFYFYFSLSWFLLLLALAILSFMCFLFNFIFSLHFCFFQLWLFFCLMCFLFNFIISLYFCFCIIFSHNFFCVSSSIFISICPDFCFFHLWLFISLCAFYLTLSAINFFASVLFSPLIFYVCLLSFLFLFVLIFASFNNSFVLWKRNNDYFCFFPDFLKFLSFISTSICSFIPL